MVGERGGGGRGRGSGEGGLAVVVVVMVVMAGFFTPNCTWINRGSREQNNRLFLFS